MPETDCQNLLKNLVKIIVKTPGTTVQACSTWIIIVEDGDLHRVLWADLQVAVVHLRIEANLHHHRRCHSHIS